MITSSSLTQVRYIKETQWGETPVAGTTRELRITGETLNFNLTKDSSKEINRFRQVRSLAVTNAEAVGDINFELSYKEYDPFFESLMRNSWESAEVEIPAGTVTLEPAAGDLPARKKLTLTAPATGLDTSQFRGGYVSMLDDSGGSPVFVADVRVLDYEEDETGLTALFFPSNADIALGAFAGMTFSVDSLRIGNQQKSFTIEKNFTDSAQFFRFTGMQVSKMDLSLQDGNFLTGTFSFVGRRGNRADATALPGEPQPSFGGDSMSAVTGVTDVMIGGQLVSEKYGTWIKELTMSFDNQLEGQTALGELGAVAVMSKTVQITGSMNLYLSDGSLYDDFVASVTNNFSFVVRDPAGNGYAFVFDKIDFNEMPANASAQDQAVMLEAKWTALMGADTENSLTIYRIGNQG